MTTRKELIESLRSKGIDNIWGRGLTTRTKAELLEYLNHIEGGSSIRHLSYSQLVDFQLCGLRYYFRRVDPKAPKFPLPGMAQLGRAYDAGVSQGLEEKLVSGSEPNLASMTDCFKETLDDKNKEIDWTGEDKPWLENQGVELVKLYRAIIPKINPTAVQDRFSISFANRDYQLMVVPDLEAEITQTVQVVDHKIGKKSPAEYEAAVSDQLTGYALSHEMKKGSLPDRVAIHRAVALKSQPKKETVDRCYELIKGTDDGVIGICVLESARTREQTNRYLKTLELNIRLIRQSIFLPARSGFWPCLPDSCVFWDYCHKEF